MHDERLGLLCEPRSADTIAAMSGLRFSVFELDRLSGELTRGGRKVAIAPQPFKALWLLASRAGDVVSRDDLRRALWADHTHVEFDRSLNFCIAEVRRALGDSARQPRFIETLPQRGYRFIAEVRRVDSDPPIAGAVDVHRPEPVQGHAAGWRRWLWAAVIPWLLGQLPAAAIVHTRTTANPRALAEFDRGQALQHAGAGGLRQSLEAFESAARLDGRFAEAHYAVAATYSSLAAAGALPSRQALGRARAEAERAITLEDVADSRQLLGTIRLVRDWDWDGARRDLTRAVSLEPTATSSLMRLAEFLSAAGDDAGALGVMDRAERLSPTCDLLLLESAWLHYRARRYDEALAKLDGAQRWGPPGDRPKAAWLAEIHELTLLVRVQQREWTIALAEVQALTELAGASDVGRPTTMPPRQAVAQFFDRSLDRLRPAGVRGEGSRMRLARIAALGGRDDEALAWLERAIRDRDSDVVSGIRDPAFDALRQRPRFTALEQTITGG